MVNLSERGHAVRQAILSATLPQNLEEEIAVAYRQLQGDSAVPLDVAVRSSATAEDLLDASFAGQQETYLNVQGVREVAARGASELDGHNRRLVSSRNEREGRTAGLG